MLFWISGSKEKAFNAMKGQKLLQEDVISKPEDAPQAILDENVDWQQVENYVETETMAAIQNLGILLIMFIILS